MGLHDKSPPRASILGIIAALALIPLTAGAQVDVVKNAPGNPDENVLFQAQAQVGNPVFGVTNQTNQQVKFTGEEDLNAQQAQGQAVLTAVDGAFNALCVDLNVAGNTLTFFTELEFAVDATGDGTISFEVFHTGSGSPYTETLNITDQGVGQNRFNVISTGGVLLTQVCFDTDPDIVRAIQFRIGGVQGGPPDIDEIPEPGSLALLAGGGLPLLGFLRRRRAR